MSETPAKSGEPLTCRDTTWLVSEARERALTDAEQAALASHIRTCSLCQGASRQFEVLFRQLERFLGHAPGDGPVAPRR